MEELAELGKKLDQFWRKLKPGEHPPGLKWTKEKPELWIEPRNSVILQVIPLIFNSLIIVTMQISTTVLNKFFFYCQQKFKLILKSKYFIYIQISKFKKSHVRERLNLTK